MSLSKTDLIKKGVYSLRDAESSTVAGNYKVAEVEISIANAYARLAEALGEKRIAGTAERYNW